MEVNFTPSVDYSFTEEGGFVDNPNDPGGATNLGITLTTLDDWENADLPVSAIRSLQRPLAEQIYHKNYWLKMDCDKLPAGVDLMVFDSGINIGPGRAIEQLQDALVVDVDGQIGPQTLAAATKMSAHELVADLALIEQSYYRSLSRFPIFGRGWLARVDRRVIAALKLVAPSHT
jgi:lysozyme family protein